MRCPLTCTSIAEARDQGRRLPPPLAGDASGALARGCRRSGAETVENTGEPAQQQLAAAGQPHHRHRSPAAMDDVAAADHMTGCPCPTARQRHPQRAAASALPRINELEAAALEIADVARGDGCPAAQRDGGNLRVEGGDWPSRTAPGRRNLRIGHRCGTVEWQDAAAKVLGQDRFQRRAQAFRGIASPGL